MTGTCRLCGRDEQRLTEHHLIPRERHNKKVKRELNSKERNKTEGICRPCHSQIHDLFTNKQLEREFNTIELLQAQESVKTWIKWVRKRNVGLELK